MSWRRYSALLLQLSLSGMAIAGQIDAIPSCHDKSLPPAAAPVRELFVAIDQTTPLSPALQQLVANNIKPFLVAGNSFTIIVFSAYTQGHYTEVLASGKLDAPLAPALRADIAKPVLTRLDQCAQRQPQQAAQLAGQALRTAYQGTSSAIAKSDVLASLKAIATMVKQSPAQDKAILVVSDMLENSSIANFYADQGRAVRRIDAAHEMGAVQENHLLADFGGARFYVIGAGLLADDVQQAKSYRDPKTMQALASFWNAYLEKSNARMVEFGQPALLNPVH